MIPILAKIVGAASMVGGAIFFLVGCVLIFVQGENTKLFAALFMAASILQMATGFVVLKYGPQFMLAIRDKHRNKL